jgi:ribosomal protein L29
MPQTDRDHHDAYEALHATFGERTDAVIHMLRPDEGMLATKDDVSNQGLALRADMAHLRTELKTEMADLRTELKTEMGDLRTELKTEMGDLRTELRTGLADLRVELAELRVEFSSDIREAFAAQTRTLVIGLISAVLLIALSNSLAVLAG